MFHGAHEIQEWLKECARRIASSLGPKDFLDKKPKRSLPYLSTVVWTTPLGLPVCQPYRKFDLKAIHTLMSNIYLHKSQRHRSRQRLVNKQLHSHRIIFTRSMRHIC